MTSPHATVTLAIPLDGLSVTAAPPDTLTQRNVEQVTGVPAEAYLELIRAPGLPFTVAKVGKLRVVDRAAFVRWLLSQDRARAAAPANDAPEPAPTGDRFLAELGLEPVAPAPRARRVRSAP